MSDFLGLGIPDEIDKSIKLAPNPCGIKWAKVTAAVGSRAASLSWHISDSKFELHASIPRGYSAEVILPKEVMGREQIEINGNRANRWNRKQGEFKGNKWLTSWYNHCLKADRC